MLKVLHYCLLKMPDQEEGKIIPMYFGHFQENLKPMLLPWLALGGTAAFPFPVLRIFPAGNGALSGLMRILVYLGPFLLYGLCQQIFPPAAVPDNSAGVWFRNALLMMTGTLPGTLAVMAVSAAVPFVLVYSVPFCLLPFF